MDILQAFDHLPDIVGGAICWFFIGLILPSAMLMRSKRWAWAILAPFIMLTTIIFCIPLCVIEWLIFCYMGRIKKEPIIIVQYVEK